MKKASIKLIRKTSPLAEPGYEVVQLVNCASFSIGSRFYRVGDELVESEADLIATDRRFEVTIGKAK